MDKAVFHKLCEMLRSLGGLVHFLEDINDERWKYFKQNFDIPNTEIMRKKMLSALATSWRDFKTFLTREYVFGERQNETPCLKYQITDKEWMQFRATRLDPSWQAKRVDAQERQSKNDAPHLLSREGYELKKKKMMKARVEASEASPPRYKIAARTKSDRQMTSKSARVIVDNIEGLVEQTTHGLFVLHGRDDILTTAIGRPEHAGRVRGIDGSWSHRDYFGAPPSRSNTFDSCTQEAMQRIEMKFEEKLKNIRQEFEQKFELLARSQQQTAVFQQQIVVAHDGVRVSSKGSCAAPDPSGEQTHSDVPNQCELYVEDDPPRLVAICRVFLGGSTIHGVPLEPDWTRVVVDQVQDVAAPVPLPNTQVQLVGQANDTFLAWPKRLVMPLSSLAKDFINRGKEVMRELVIDDADIAEAEDDPIFRLLTILPRLKRKPIQLQWDIRVFGVDSSNVPLYISLADALKIVGKNSMLNISIIQLWAMYMDKLSVEQTQAQVYEFIEPQSIQKSRNTRVQIQQYMQTWMSESGRHIYMAPYIEGSHWQLMIIIPKEYTVVWFCSLHRKPSHEMKCQLQG
uniref:DUF8039 domain-containing protein n=1 Tax=Cajanus cajan TaxID=3821 RepID=A0A151U5Z2_CAJCA|nr:hypothetical protein KK1_007443 [Cajanus cajan]